MAETTTETVVTPDPELDAVTKFANANAGALPANFKSPEEFIASWKEQRATLTKTQQELAELKKTAPPAKPEERPPAPTPTELKITPDEPSSDEWNVWGQELTTTGDISPETRAEIKAKFKVPDAMIDSFVASEKANRASAASKAAELVGGPDALNGIINWAKTNLSKEEIESVNAAFTRPGWDTTLLGLQQKMAAQSPIKGEPKRTPGVVNGGVVNTNAQPYASSQEQIADFRNPKYGVDPEFTQQVYARAAATAKSR